MKAKEKKEMERLQALEAYRKQRQKQSNEIIKNNYDRISCTLPKGTKERITESGQTVNGLINKLVIEYLEELKKNK